MLDIDLTTIQYKVMRMQRLPTYVSGLLIVLICYLLWQFYIDYKGIVAPVMADVKSLTFQPLPKIARMHLFGDYEAALARALPATQLDLKLMGVFFSSTSGQSQALMQAPGQPETLYSKGDVVPGGAILDKILARSVILKHDERLESLMLKVPKLDFLPPPKNTLLQSGETSN